MSVKLHRQAEQFMAEAEMLEVDGRHDEAKARWFEAARMEAEAFTHIPEDRRKTRGIIAVSAVALFRRAGALDKAIHAATGYLAAGDLPVAWQAELKILLEKAREESQTPAAG
jgi:hypothetical protein